jgi:hypothetical protein
MTKRPLSNVPASIHQRLLSLSEKNVEDFNLVLKRYAAERLLFRLSKSKQANQFVLKGAMLFSVWVTLHGHFQRKDESALFFPAAVRIVLSHGGRPSHRMSQLQAS